MEDMIFFTFNANVKLDRKGCFDSADLQSIHLFA